MASEEFERREEERAAAEAARIGGSSGQPSLDEQGEPVDEAHRPLAEAGEGVAEGFEQAEEALIEHASHGDQHAARRVIENAPAQWDDPRTAEGAEADREHSSEQDDEHGR
jgi:hypothetical protein